MYKCPFHHNEYFPSTLDRFVLDTKTSQCQSEDGKPHNDIEGDPKAEMIKEVPYDDCAQEVARICKNSVDPHHSPKGVRRGRV